MHMFNVWIGTTSISGSVFGRRQQPEVRQSARRCTLAFTPRPLVVDLDGTLIKTDLLLETASQFVLAQPWQTYKLLAWLSQGKSAFKTHLAQNTSIDAAALPYNQELLIWLKQE